MIKKIALLAALAFVGYSLFTLGSIKTGSEFKVKLDSLSKVNDSLYTENKQDDSTIAELKVLDSSLVYKVEHQKTKIVKVKEVVVIKQNEIDTYDKHQLVNFYYVRYPKDTTTNRIPVAQPVLVSAAKDLVAYDGAVKEITIKDSVIAIQESRITLKDSTIGLYINKEGRYKSIIGNKDQAIAEWSKQYDILNLNYKKLQVKNKFQKIGSYVIIGGLAYTLLVH
jgi:hypothetical protein